MCRLLAGLIRRHEQMWLRRTQEGEFTRFWRNFASLAIFKVFYRRTNEVYFVLSENLLLGK